MLIRFGYEIEIDTAGPVPMFNALCTHSNLAGRLIGSDRIRTEPAIPVREYVDPHGNRVTRMVAPGGPLRLWSDCAIEVAGEADPVVPGAIRHPVEDLPDSALHFLLASRYCDSDNLVDFAWQRFGGVEPGWPLVQAICDFVHGHITFGYCHGRSNKTASDTLREATGVCRDFAHLAIALCRAMNVPARYCSGYLGDIGVPRSGPGDFCAWFEVFLGGRWYTFDARYNMPRIGRIVMVRGRDAADVAMVTSFGSYKLKLFRVWTDQIPQQSDAQVRSLLETRPGAEALVFPTAA